MGEEIFRIVELRLKEDKEFLSKVVYDTLLVIAKWVSLGNEVLIS